MGIEGFERLCNTLKTCTLRTGTNYSWTNIISTVSSLAHEVFNDFGKYKSTFPPFDKRKLDCINGLKNDSSICITRPDKDRHALAAMKLNLELAKIEREQQTEALQQQKEALQIKKEESALKKEEQEREAALKKEEQEREAALQREREREQLEARKRHLEMQREHDKKQADSVLEYHRQELDLETTHHTQRQQATASLPVSF
ncbi:coiled-coil domain-containing protein 42 like-2-like [Procambarus clarkii]|uniref:coiled-coil domain-containing protein 42 like-2-like n=1 Tax=Procambarus clarkii TaxID=6728 RepID=UPI0037447FFA